MTRSNLLVSALLFLSLSLTGCQPKVYLMPPPLAVNESSGYFDLSEDSRDGNLLYSLYATNRVPLSKSKNSDYSIFPSDTLRFGYVVHRVGEAGMSWEELHKQSTTRDRDEDLLIKKIYAREVTEYNRDDHISRRSASADGYFEQINSWLSSSYDKNLLVYVHGANSNFYRATAQGAQMFHYTGHNSVVCTFSWPSAESLLKYNTDVLHARQSVPAFSRFIELLAIHTKARKINIVAYSAGAQVVVPALVHLRKNHPELSDEELQVKLRLGEIYLAAPDVEFKSFVQNYIQFRGIVARTTINLNRYDSILQLAAFQNGVSRLGRPDVRELEEGDTSIMLEAMRSPYLNILNVGDSTSLNLGGTHNSWYSHPWVSNDLLLLMLFGASPLERGLEQYISEEGATGYYFPVDYEQRVEEIISRENEEVENRKQASREGSDG